MKQNNLLLNISDQQLHQAGLTRAQARKSLAALDYRDNDVFRHVMNAENPVCLLYTSAPWPAEA